MKLKRFEFPGIGGKTHIPSASIGYTGAVNISKPLAEELKWPKDSRISVYLDEEQDTIEQELIVYMTPEKHGVLKLGNYDGTFRVNLQSLMKTKFPKFETGKVIHSIEEIEGVRYLRLIIAYGEPVNRLARAQQKKKEREAKRHIIIPGKPPLPANKNPYSGKPRGRKKKEA